MDTFFVCFPLFILYLDKPCRVLVMQMISRALRGQNENSGDSPPFSSSSSSPFKIATAFNYALHSRCASIERVIIGKRDTDCLKRGIGFKKFTSLVLNHPAMNDQCRNLVFRYSIGCPIVCATNGVDSRSRAANT